MNKVQSLNPEQQIVVAADKGFYEVLAGPGAGKSACIAARYKRLAAEYGATSVLSLTFTSVAAKEMGKRAGAIEHGPIASVTPFGFRTFHSLALSFALQERAHFDRELAEYPLAVEGQDSKIAGGVGRRFNIDYRKLTERIATWKREGIRPPQAIAEAETTGKEIVAALAYQEYEDKLRGEKLLDFGGLMLEMVSVLTAKPDVLERWSPMWLQTDESQDNDRQQFELLRLLSRKHGNLMCVGDAGQAIYQWRGSHPELFLNMAEMFPSTQTLYLAKNHRSTPTIVNLLKRIGPVPELAEKFYTENPDGPGVRVVANEEPQGEARALATMGGMCLMPEPFAAFSGYGGGDGKEQTVAILARTNRYLRAIEEQLSEQGVRYHLIGNTGFWSQPEVKAVLAYLQLSLGYTDAAVLGALRAPFWPSRGINKTELARHLKSTQSGDPSKPALWGLLCEYSRFHSNAERFANGLREVRLELANKTAQAAVAAALGVLKAVEYYEDDQESPDNDPVGNLKDIERIAGRYPTLDQFLEFVRKSQNASRVKKGVALATIHASKGGQWATVIVAGCHVGLLPHEKGELDEEKRLWFVAASRPERRLIVSYAGKPSPFLAEAGLVAAQDVETA